MRCRPSWKDHSRHEPRDTPAFSLDQEDLLAERIVVRGFLLLHGRGQRRRHQKICGVSGKSRHGQSIAGFRVLVPKSTGVSPWVSTLPWVVCTFGVVWLIARSQFGLGLVSIREDEQVARAFGVSIFWYKCRALVISAALAAALGPIYLSDRLYINPGEMFGLETALMPITMAILRGSGLLIGPVVGVMSLSLVQELLWTQVCVLRLASLGLVLAMVGLFMPGGLVRLAPVYSRLHRWGLVGGYKVFQLKCPTSSSVDGEFLHCAQVTSGLSCATHQTLRPWHPPGERTSLARVSARPHGRAPPCSSKGRSR